MPWLGKVEKPFGDESRRLLTHDSIIRGCELLTELFKSSLGPRGSVKLVLQPFPMRSQITSDGKTILTSLGSVHPGAWILREMAYSQINLGDGVTTTMVLAGELLKCAKKLLDAKVKAAVIVHGYTQALRFALKVFPELSVPADWADGDQMVRVARTAAGTKSTGLPSAKLAEFGAVAVRCVTEMRGTEPYPDIGNICVLKMVGAVGAESRLIKGIAFQRRLIHPAMPKRQEGVRIALLGVGLEFKKFWEQRTPVKVEIQPDGIGSMIEARLDMAKRNVEKIAAAGANVVVTKHGIDDLHAGLLAGRAIQAVQWVPDSGGIGRLAKASGGTAVSTLDDLRPGDLGRAETAEEVRVPRFDTRMLEREVKTPDGHTVPDDDRIFVIDGCRDPKSVTILLRAQTETVLNESERALDAAISACQALVREPRIVGGAGAFEAELAHRLRGFALTFEDKTQLVVQAYADAIEGLVEALAENAGIDPIDACTKIASAHANGGAWTGIDLFRKRLENAFDLGVVEPLRVKRSAIKIASEAACQLMRIDRILKGYSAPKLMPGELPPGASEGPDILTDAKDLPDETIKAYKKAKYVTPYGSKTKLNL